MKSHHLLAAVLLGALSTAACEKPSSAGSNRTTYSYYEKKEYAYDQRDAFRADMQRAVDKLEARLAELRAKVSRGGEKVKDDTQRAIDDIEARLPELRRNLEEMGNATQDGWQDFKRKFHETFDDMGRRLDRAFD